MLTVNINFGLRAFNILKKLYRSIGPIQIIIFDEVLPNTVSHPCYLTVEGSKNIFMLRITTLHSLPCRLFDGVLPEGSRTFFFMARPLRGGVVGVKGRSLRKKNVIFLFVGLVPRVRGL